MKEITFEGIRSGDHECFCWDVTREVYKEVTGRFPGKYDKSTFNKSGKKKLYRLYAGAIMDALGVKSNCKVTISVEEPIDLVRTLNCATEAGLKSFMNKRAEIVKRVGKRLGSEEAGVLWLNLVQISTGKTPLQMIVDGQMDVLETLLDDQESDFPSYS